MIANDQELQVSLERIAHFQTQLTQLHKAESNPANYHAVALGFLAEIDRMQLEVRDYLSIHPAEIDRMQLEVREYLSIHPAEIPIS